MARFRALESIKAPVALYGTADRLWLLTREPRKEEPRQEGLGEGGTRWLLHEIDPERDRLLGAVELPTRAPHLLIAPGPKHWAILEKGRMRPDRSQDHSRLLLVPSPWIEQGGEAGKVREISRERCRG